MNSIFASKALLDAEYKRLFLNKLSHLDELKEAIKARYDKKDISDETLRKILSNNHKAIFDFIGSHNESRIRNFFGVPQFPDDRDSKIRVADRLILDAVHFDIIATLMIRFATEYSQDQVNIDKEWQTEIDAIHELELITPFLTIQNAIKLNKQRVFCDLVFPEQQSNITLFYLKGNSVIPNGNIFTNWLPKEKSNQLKTTLLYISAALVAGGCMILPLIFTAGATSLLTIISTAIIALLLIATISGIIWWTTLPNEPVQGDVIKINESHSAINSEISHNNQIEKNSEEAPFHNSTWNLTASSSENSLSSNETDEDNARHVMNGTELRSF
ncbi:hypothetical protein [Legionella shakespearei]|uniref:Uncharacterized protein n=1 Tax=Legionella shakespearei DSM 23087 TaxID=1122169 RepID=A0A0W0YVN8_9GAMM|nr:hypothetical protein [Legionella shakespearei]KTD60945.1 hypothetical protein Lsha_1356 [Legionella shakespearei DSM 23087]